MKNTEISLFENNTKSINARLRRGRVLFRFQRVKEELFSVRDSKTPRQSLSNSYYIILTP